MPMAPHSYDNQAASQMRNILQQPEYHRISPVNPDPFLGTWPADQSVPHLNTSRLFPVILILQIHNILKPMLSWKLDEHSFFLLHSLPTPQIHFWRYCHLQTVLSKVILCPDGSQYYAEAAQTNNSGMETDIASPSRHLHSSLIVIFIFTIVFTSSSLHIVII